MTARTTVLIIDDDISFRKLLEYTIRREGFKTLEAGDIKTALQVLEAEEVQVVLTDVYLPDGNGVELVRMLKASYPLIEILAMTSQGKIADGVTAIKNGAFDYLQKGEDDYRLIPLLTGAAEKARAQSAINALNNDVNKYENHSDIIAQNAEQLEQATLIIKAIHSALRQKILHLLFTKGKASVIEIYTELDMKQSICSQHLCILLNAGLVQAEREGQHIYYTANYTGIEKIILFVQQLLGKDNSETGSSGIKHYRNVFDSGNSKCKFTNH